MSCLGFLSPQQRAALAASSRDDAAGAPLSSFASPPATVGKLRRLRALATSSDPTIRESAALAYLAPPDVLHRLASDPVASVRCCVARNDHATPSLLRRLAADPDPQVRGWVAANPAVPADVHERLAGDADPTVRAVLAWADGWSSR
ncbi:hypothetical protein [Nocardioides sp.]|uniref:hypothetical protein n=1 Tax=Nocardioides sp. TaxID=35761 RepID=UPI0039E61BCB